MALRKCNECKNQVSSRATICPQCGAPVKRKTSPLAGAIALLIIIAVCTGIFTNSENGPMQRNLPSTGPTVAPPKARKQRSTKAPVKSLLPIRPVGVRDREPFRDWVPGIQLPPYEVVFEDTERIARTSGPSWYRKYAPKIHLVELLITLDERPSEPELRALLGSLYEKAKKTQPDVVYIFAFGKKNYHKNSGSNWIGMLSWSRLAVASTIRINSLNLKAQFEEASRRFGMSEKRRKQIYWKICEIEAKARRLAEKKVPNPETLEDSMRQEGEFDKLCSRFFRTHGISFNLRIKILVEGASKNWPEPQ